MQLLVGQNYTIHIALFDLYVFAVTEGTVRTMCNGVDGVEHLIVTGGISLQTEMRYPWQSAAPQPFTLALRHR